MSRENIEAVFSQENLEKLFPKIRANEFFEALFGDADEGAFDIELAYSGRKDDQLHLELVLHERPGHCLACNLTQGLPQVFSRHPVINIDGLVKEIDSQLGETVACGDWALGYTVQKSSSIHAIPLRIDIAGS